MTNVEKFKNIVTEIADTYEKKNADYGNSFEKTLDKWGVNIGLARIEDKFNRVTRLLSSSCQQVKDESVEDTLRDLATYSIMLLMWLKKTNTNNTIQSSNKNNNFINLNDKFKYLESIKNWKIVGGINSKGFPTKTMYADVDRYCFIPGTAAIEIHFKNVRNTRNQIVGSGTYVDVYDIEKLSEIGLGKQ